MINSNDFWAMAVDYDIMYRHPTHPMFWNRGYNYDSVDLTSHLSTYQHGYKEPSQSIADQLFIHQTNLGLTSDLISDGLWLSDFTNSVYSYFSISSVSQAGSGIAWNYLTNNKFICYNYSTNVGSLLTKNGFHWDTNVTLMYVRVGLDQDDPTVTMNSYIKILNPSYMGFQDGSDYSTFNPDYATAIENGFYHHPILNETGNIQLRPRNSSPSFNPDYQISADVFLPETEGFFDETIVASNSTVQAMQSHISDLSIHLGIDDTYLRNDAAFSADYLDALGEKNYLDMPPSGDGWFTHDGLEIGPRTDEDTTDTYIAIAGHSVGHVEIYHPDSGELLGASVNGKGGIRARFSIERGKVPVCPPNVTLRRLNSVTGYSDISNLRNL